MTSSTKFSPALPIWIYSGLLIVYAVFSYTLTAPNLILTSWPPYWQFQTWMWQHFFNNRQLLGYSYLGLITALVASYGLILWWLKQHQSRLKNVKWYLPLLAALPLLLANPSLSYDLFNYLFNAKMVVVYQANPHVQTALDFAQDDWVRFMHNTHTPAPYFYGWTALSILPYLLGMGKLLTTLISFKLFSYLSLILLAWVLKNRVWSQHNDNDSLFWYFGLLFNPLLLIEVLGNGHNDLWMMVPAVAALMMVVKRPSFLKIFGSLILLLISISIKLATLVLAPIWLLLILSNSALFQNLLRSLPQLLTKLESWAVKNWAGLSSIGLFLPLLTARSKQFLPWYLIWSLVWLPLMNQKWRFWQVILSLFSIAALYRYLPFLLAGSYEDPVTLQQLLITWIPPVIAAFGFWLWQFKRTRLQ